MTGPPPPNDVHIRCAAAQESTHASYIQGSSWYRMVQVILHSMYLV
jgi:hypothetical protein